MLFRNAWKSLHDYRDELDKREAVISKLQALVEARFEDLRALEAHLLARESAIRCAQFEEAIKHREPPAG